MVSDLCTLKKAMTGHSLKVQSLRSGFGKFLRFQLISRSISSIDEGAKIKLQDQEGIVHELASSVYSMAGYDTSVTTLRDMDI